MTVVIKYKVGGVDVHQLEYTLVHRGWTRGSCDGDWCVLDWWVLSDDPGTAFRDVPGGSCE